MTFHQPLLEKITGRYNIAGANRLYKKKYILTPLKAVHGSGRFNAPDREFKGLYCALSFSTALQEGLIRDRFEKKQTRRIASHTLKSMAVVHLRSTSPLTLLDLTEGKASTANIPTQIRNARDYEQSQAFALFVHQNMDHIDGILYPSRFDEKHCIFLFERGLSEVEKKSNMALTQHPETEATLRELNVTIFKWRGID